MRRDEAAGPVQLVEVEVLIYVLIEQACLNFKYWAVLSVSAAGADQKVEQQLWDWFHEYSKKLVEA